MICIACVWRNNLLTWFDMSLDRLMSFFGSPRWSSTYSFWGSWNRIGRFLTSCSLRGRNLRHVWGLFWRMSGKDFDEFSLAEACFLFIDGIVLCVPIEEWLPNWMIVFSETSSTKTLKCSHLKPFHSTCRGNLYPQGCGHSTCWRVRCEFFFATQPPRLGGWRWEILESHLSQRLFKGPTHTTENCSKPGGGRFWAHSVGYLFDSYDLPEILLIMACQVFENRTS